jgi:CysZ protein
MDKILAALTKGLASLLHPRMLWLMIWPMVIALALWIVLAALYWGRVLSWIGEYLHQSALYESIASNWPFTLVAAWLGWVLLLVLLVPLVLITGVVIISVVAMPAIVAHVGERDYPGLARKEGGSIAGSLWNAVAALLLVSLLFALTLPLWLIPPLWPVLPILLFGYFNQRVFRYDALAGHGSTAEIAQVIRRYRGELFLLGLALALLGHVPVLGLFMPVYGGLVFVHYGLGRLGELRSEPIEGTARRV